MTAEVRAEEPTDRDEPKDRHFDISRFPNRGFASSTTAGGASNLGPLAEARTGHACQVLSDRFSARAPSRLLVETVHRIRGLGRRGLRRSNPLLRRDARLYTGRRYLRRGPRQSAGFWSPRPARARRKSCWRCAIGPEQASRVGNQTGGRVFLFLHTDDFWRDFETLKARGVIFVRQPKRETYGTVAVFEDLYGNRWDLIQLEV